MPRMRTPGPGAYDLDFNRLGNKNSLGGSHSARGSSMFKSDSAQRGRLGGKDDAGDPALYDTFTNEALSNRARRTFNRSISAGSIGFSSSARGRPANPAAGSMRGGPGENDYSHLYKIGGDSGGSGSEHHRQRGGGGTAAFMSALPSSAGHIRKSFTPGIGTYDTSTGSTVSSPAKGTYSREGMASFAGTVPRKGLAETKRTEAHVAPGAYDLGGSMEDNLREATNPRLPAFSSSMPRDTYRNTRGKIPGPGEYDSFKETLEARSQRSFNTDATKGNSRFLSTSARRGIADVKEYGDGGADGEEVDSPGVNKGNKESLSARSRRSFNRSVTSGGGSFNVRSPARTRSPAAGSMRGGPGENDFSHMYSCGNATTPITSSFSSALPSSSGHIRKSTTSPNVGVGSYAVERSALSKSVTSVPGTYSKEGMATFVGTVSRRDMASKATEPQVAPGAYDLTRYSMEGKMKAKANPRLPGFGSSMPRSVDDYDY